MTFDGDRRYPAEPAAVFDLFCQPDVITARYASQGDRDIEILSCGPDGDDFVIETRRTVEINLPGFAKKVLAPTNTMLQTDRWGPADRDGSRAGTFAVEVRGAPVSTSGSMSIAPDGDGTRHQVSGTIEVKVALVGGRIAKWSEGTARDTLAAEFDFHQARLAAE